MEQITISDDFNYEFLGDRSTFYFAGAGSVVFNSPERDVSVVANTPVVDKAALFSTKWLFGYDLEVSFSFAINSAIDTAVCGIGYYDTTSYNFGEGYYVGFIGGDFGFHRSRAGVITTKSLDPIDTFRNNTYRISMKDKYSPVILEYLKYDYEHQKFTYVKISEFWDQFNPLNYLYSSFRWITYSEGGNITVGNYKGKCEVGNPVNFGISTTVASIAGTEVLLIGFRNRTNIIGIDYGGGAIIRRIKSFANLTSETFVIRVYKYMSITGPAWNNLDISSGVEYTTAGVIGSGTVLREFTVNDDIKMDFQITDYFSPVVITAQRLTGGSARDIQIAVEIDEY